MAGDSPVHLATITTLLRDAFLHELVNQPPQAVAASRASQQVKTTLLQLIELHAATWQLPASAVRYYYPAAAKPTMTTAL